MIVPPIVWETRRSYILSQIRMFISTHTEFLYVELKAQNTHRFEPSVLAIERDASIQPWVEAFNFYSEVIWRGG